ncbi:MAG: bifunctional diguanylate cyclase/phosphodiesterase [Pseudomonadota bacterium]|nr:bifunctional diguanylate cyclase/phosphodiesterase [Burkholderiales bacterium]MDQ3196767.1 bifunctional diguanylate cyclase/phosphodiesterase [Pseudomonadota bacterium]
MLKRCARRARHASLDQKIIAIFALAWLATACALGLIYVDGRALHQSTLPLVGQALPSLTGLSQLRLELGQQKPILYEYYATIDRAKFLRDWRDSQSRTDHLLDAVRAGLIGAEQAAPITQAYGRFNLAARQFDDALNTARIDWERTRTLLAETDDALAELARTVDRLLIPIERSMIASEQNTGQRLNSLFTTIGFFALIVLVTGVFFVITARAWLREAGNRRRLAMFAERDPNPVMSLAADGRVVYANRGAEKMLKMLGGASATAATLLPQDLGTRLQAMRSAGIHHDKWIYPAAALTLSCRVHFLKDQNSFHCYLSDVTRRKRAERQLVFQAYYDGLTGLPNRRMFERRLETLLTRRHAAGIVVLLKLDRFQLLISSFGHVVCDQILQNAAARLTDVVRNGGQGGNPRAGLYRLDGGRFAMIACDAGKEQIGEALTKDIVEAMNTPLEIDGREVFVTFSVGLSSYPPDGVESGVLLKNAESAMHYAEQRGGHGYQSYSEQLNSGARERLDMENALRRAIEREQLELFYQPQLDVASGRIVGAEALMRWRLDGRGIVGPGEFIPLAEETGLIVPIGIWALETACRQAKIWQGLGYADLTVAVNISGRQFLAADLPQTVARILRHTGLPAALLELEITESVAMKDVDLTIATLCRLKQLGVKLSIDDFGTGYSSLGYLKRFPIDKLKIDRSFLCNVTSDPSDAAIAQAVIALGRSLNLTVLAEGIETPQQLDLLRRFGCKEMQGYLFSCPVPVDQFSALLRGGGYREPPPAREEFMLDLACLSH